MTDRWRRQHADRRMLDVRLTVGASLAGVVAASLVGCAANPAAAPRSVDRPVAAFAEAYADWAPRYVECARSFGADAELLPDGGIENAVAPGRASEKGLDAACLTTVGPEPTAPPVTEELLVGLYVLYLQQADCLRDAGHAVSTPPSRREWVENYSGESWNPLLDVANAGGDLWEAMDVCPQPDPVEAERIGIEQSEQG